MKKISILFIIILAGITVFSSDIALEYLNDFLSGSFDKAFELQDDAMRGAFGEAAMQNALAGIEFQFGRPAGAVQTIRQAPAGENKVSLIEVEYDHLYLDYTVSVDKNGKVAGFFYKTGRVKESEMPDYLSETNAVETVITIGDEPYVLDGVLTVPKNSEKYPVVVIVTGSGSHDKDGTIGPNKIYRDIALGLANIGMASVRYEKRTYRYGADSVKIAPTDDATYIRFEYTDDIYKALDFCESIPGNTGSILLGHSEGGMIIPTIAYNDSRVTKMVLLASTIRRFAQISIDQNLYIESISDLTEQQKQAVKQAVEFFTLILEHKIPADTQIQPGLYVAYYYNLDKYLPLPILEKLSTPTLVIQGEKDFQATMNDDFIPMKEALKGKSNYTFVPLPNLDHFFKPVEGEMATLESINEKGHPQKILFDTIQNWFLAQKQ